MVVARWILIDTFKEIQTKSCKFETKATDSNILSVLKNHKFWLKFCFHFRPVSISLDEELLVPRNVGASSWFAIMLCMASHPLGSFAIDIVSRQIRAFHHVIILLYVLIINCRGSNTRINNVNNKSILIPKGLGLGLGWTGEFHAVVPNFCDSSSFEL